MHRGGYRRNQGLQYGLIMLAMQAVNFGIDRIPPITLALLVGQALLYLGAVKVPWNAEDVCISTTKILKRRDWTSFFVSNFEHGSDMHLYYNMVSLILKGSFLEPMYGMVNFALLVGVLSVGCSSVYVALGAILTQVTADYGYSTACAIGFSGVLFALKVLVVTEEQDRLHNVGGFAVPSKLAVWAELVLIHLLVPNTSFIGHLAGIIVGSLYCYTSIGALIDKYIQILSGKPIIHKEGFYRKRSYVF